MFIREIILNKLRRVIFPTNNRDIVSNGLIKSIDVIDRNLEVVLWGKDLEKHILSTIRRNIMDNLREYQKDYSIKVHFERTPRRMNPLPPVFRAETPELFYKLAICSPRGDVLKSLFALNLAVAFAGKNFRAGLVDTDLYGAGYSLISGVENSLQYTKHQTYWMDQFGIKLFSLQKLLDIQSPSIWRGAPFEKCLQQLLADVKLHNLQILLFDLPPGSGDSLLALIQTVGFDGIILLARSGEEDKHCLQKSIHLLDDFKVPILGVVANTGIRDSRSSGKHEEKIEFPKEVEDLGVISLDTIYRETTRKNNPILDGDSAGYFADLVNKISVRLYH